MLSKEEAERIQRTIEEIDLEIAQAFEEGDESRAAALIVRAGLLERDLEEFSEADQPHGTTR